MKNSLYNGKEVNVFEIQHIYQVLKFYYQELESLPVEAVVDIIRMEFGCKINPNDVYLYLLISNHWDCDGNFKEND
ncbi:MAG TPA: hypothetical protein DCX01_02015 [Bacteroidetes bacterium]|nr:hypothetical protein [Bacteroidota bacterium]